MKKMGLCVVLMLSCSCHQATSRPDTGRAPNELQGLLESYLENRDPPFTDGPVTAGPEYEFRGPLTIKQVEAEGLEGLGKGLVKFRTRLDEFGVPQVPFGFNNNRWIALKREYRDGDELYFFTADEHGWASHSGREGYLLLRKDKIVRTIITVVN